MKGVWHMLTACLPAEAALPSFYRIKSLLRRHEGACLTRIEVCPNDCIAYWNSEMLPPELAVRHAHRTKCPVCSAQRWVTDPATGKTIPAKVVFFFPVAQYIRALFARPELVPLLWWDCGEYPEGHTVRSRGWKRKVVDNPVMNRDHRSIGLVGTTDGVPFFDDQRRGAWPFFLRCANLPDGPSTEMANVHMSMLSANEYYEIDPSAKVLRRRIRAPKSLKAHMSIIVDDLLGAYKKGVCVEDASEPLHSPNRRFTCHVILLYWTGAHAAYGCVYIMIENVYKISFVYTI